jgi:hypothetical protein
VATLLVHLTLLRRALGPDEGGFAVVAHHWLEPGTYLYGPLWVDRPPGLIALFAVADHLGVWGPRLLVTGLAVTLVALVGRVAGAIGGPSAVPWATWTAFALSSSVFLQAQQLNGEIAAVVGVSASMLFLVRALDQPGHRAWAFGAGAGATAGLAMLMKQNFLDGYVFGALLLSAVALTRPASRRLATTIGTGLLLGGAAVVAATVAWARLHGGVAPLMAALYGFRLRAATVLAAGPLQGPDQRGVQLVLLCLGTGLLVLAINVLWRGREALRRRNPYAVALAGTAAFDVGSLIGGENFWPHYALAFVPVVAVAAGLAARDGRPGWERTRHIVIAMATITALASPAAAAVHGRGNAWAVGQWVRKSSHSDDSIIVTYTHPNVVEASGLRPAYPYLWSLPIRVFDPHLASLTTTLDGAGGPTWVVVWDHPRDWNLNRRNQLNRALHAHYSLVAHVCRHPVWLRSGSSRELAPLPPPSACTGGSL